jgi:membrane carboxypeptidase/penicillin-binding protein
MDSALKNTPTEEFKVPSGITLVKVNIDTGLPSDGDSPETVLEAFIEGTAPTDKGDQRKEESSLDITMTGKHPMDSYPGGY